MNASHTDRDTDREVYCLADIHRLREDNCGVLSRRHLFEGRFDRVIKVVRPPRRCVMCLQRVPRACMFHSGLVRKTDISRKVVPT